MSWIDYALAMLWFNLIGALVVYALQRFQHWLPSIRRTWPRSARIPRSTRDELRHQHQLAGLRRREHDELPDADARPRVQNFVSAASGMAVLVALIRGFSRKQAGDIGNFWFDLVRRRSTSCCRCRSSRARAGEPGRGADVRQVRDGDARAAGDVSTRPRTAGRQPLKDDKGNAVTEKTTATEQTIPLGPARRRSRSSSSAPTAAASSTSTRRTRSRIRRR
jgi:K+-transporting ATPase ATPase A chain